MTKFLKNELTKDNVGGGTAEDQQDNIGKIFRIFWSVYNNDSIEKTTL